MKQTAVEWLINEIWNNPNSELNKELFNQAKEMEKKQIIRAFDDGLYSWDNEDDDIGIDYYNKKFKNK